MLLGVRFTASLTEEWSKGRATLLGSRKWRFESFFFSMLIATVLVLVAASALRPFELKQGFHELSALLTGTLILGWQLGGGLAGPKLGFNGSIILDPTTLLGAGVLVGSAMVVSQT